jgi:putative iron-only hydrogenase system regulator
MIATQLPAKEPCASSVDGAEYLCCAFAASLSGDVFFYAERSVSKMNEKTAGELITGSRVAAISVIVERGGDVEALNRLLHDYRDYIVGRMGIPYRQRGISIISIVIDAPQNDIATLTGKIGNMPGITVKTAYSAVQS